MLITFANGLWTLHSLLARRRPFTSWQAWWDHPQSSVSRTTLKHHIELKVQPLYDSSFADLKSKVTSGNAMDLGKVPI